MELLLNPLTLFVIAFVVALAFIASPYEINFEDGDEIDF